MDIESESQEGIVVTYSRKESGRRRHHEIETHRALARKLANIKGWRFEGEFDASKSYPAPLYFVPSDTLSTVALAESLGIRNEQDLFGGVVPYSFVATKSITHTLVDDDAVAPKGWSHDFSSRAQDVVLTGFTVFSFDDALKAGTRLLMQGAVRLKKSSGIGGLDQFVVRDEQQLLNKLQSMNSAEMMRDGLVLEVNLTDVETYSVGQVKVGNVLATYYGTQGLTTNNQGMEVYGGSQLVIARGDFDALLRLDLPVEMRTAVSQACVYHAAAMAAYPGLMMSRCNYDIVRGKDEQGQTRSGVLEQSWRIGGASGAEIAALEAFQRHASLDVVFESTTEIYGDAPDLPDDAEIYYQGVDPDIGPLTKYSRWKPYANP